MEFINYKVMSLKIVEFLRVYVNIERESRVILGIQILIINLNKFFIIFSLAYILGSFFSSVVVFISFAYLRQVIGGIHAKTSFRCTIISFIAIVGSAIIGSNFILGNKIIFMILILNTYLIIKYAPGDTQKNPLKHINKIHLLKREGIKRWIIISLIIIFIPNQWLKTLILFGSALAIYSVLPIIYKISNQKRPIDDFKIY